MSKRRVKRPNIKKAFEQRMFCTLCRVDMAQSQMPAHDALPSHQKRATSYRLDLAIAKAGFGWTCNR